LTFAGLTVNGTISTEADRLTYGDATNGLGVAIQGVVVNLGASTSSVTAADVYSGTGTYLSNGVTSVTGGKTAWTFATQSANNSANQQTLSSIEKVIGTDGADYFVSADAGSTITGGKGNDYIKLNAGADTVIIASSLTNNGKDTVTGFTFGTGGDKLDFSAFLGAAIDSSSAGSGSAVSTLTGVALATGTNKVNLVDASSAADANIAVVYTSTGTISTSNFAATKQTNNKIAIATTQKAIIFVATASTDTTFNVYEVTGGANVGTDDVLELVGVVTAASAISNLASGNVA
jgi:hypothetical protein